MNLNTTTVQRIIKSVAKNGGETHAKAARSIERDRKSGLGWRYDGLEAWDTDALFAKLRELQIDTDPQRFLQQAIQAGRTSTLSERWIGDPSRNPHLSGANEFWVDFPFLAAEELWMRLAPDQPCPEILSRRMDEALEVYHQDQWSASSPGVPATLRAALALVDHLETLPAQQRADYYDEVCECSLYDYTGDLMDFLMNQGSRFPDEAVRVSDAFAALDPESAECFHGDVPLYLARAGRKEEAVERIEFNLKRYPGDAWIQIHAGDAYRSLEDEDRALELYRSALRNAEDASDWEDFKDRIVSLLEKTGRMDEWPAFEEVAPRPAPSSKIWLSPPVPAVPKTLSAYDMEPIYVREPVRVGKKIGVNEPCPCGSGKKYKKCCKLKT
jgi:hypothetical protein